MSDLNSIVTINITAQTSAVSRAGFGTPLLCGYTTVFSERVRTYTAIADLVSDGFATTDAIYLMASALFSQNPRPTSFKVGRRELPSTSTINITPTAANSVTYTVAINGTEFTYLSDASATVAEITAGLTGAINAGAEPVTATDNTTYITLTADVAGALFTLTISDDSGSTVDEGLWSKDDVTTDPGIATDLAAILAENSDWYALAIDSQSGAEIAAAAAWTESNKKLFVTASADSDCYGTGSSDIMSVLNASAYDRTAIIFNAQAFKYAGCAWLGYGLPQAPGSITWAFKTLAGIPVDNLSGTAYGYIRAKKGNDYLETGGVNKTYEGNVASGEYIDITHGVDWLTARIQENVYSLLVNNGKIPFTSGGAAAIENAINGPLLAAVAVDLLVSGTIVIYVPPAAEVSAADKALRTWENITFTTNLAGAAHKIGISGTLSL